MARVTRRKSDDHSLIDEDSSMPLLFPPPPPSQLLDPLNPLNLKSRLSFATVKHLVGIGSAPQADDNPIYRRFKMIRETSSAGHLLNWHIFEAYRVVDNEECSVFVLDKRAIRKMAKKVGSSYSRSSGDTETADDIIKRYKNSINIMMDLKRSLFLKVYHGVLEGTQTLAFATEPVIGSLENILNYNNEGASMPRSLDPSTPSRKDEENDIHSVNDDQEPPVASTSRGFTPLLRKKLSASAPATPNKNHTTETKLLVEYHFLHFEYRYGLLQISEALLYLHKKRLIHRNVCPSSILVTKKGTWKLFGLEFVECTSAPEKVYVTKPWSPRLPAIVQPMLDYTAPEVLNTNTVSAKSDIFALSLLIVTIFNKGRPLLRANNCPTVYLKQIEQLDVKIKQVLPNVPMSLRETISCCLKQDPDSRISSETMSLLIYYIELDERDFNNIMRPKRPDTIEKAMFALQFLDDLQSKNEDQRDKFFEKTFLDSVSNIPKKLVWQHMWPVLSIEMRKSDVLEAILVPLIYFIKEASPERFTTLIRPTLQVQLLFRPDHPDAKDVIGSLEVLENMHHILSKCDEAFASEHIFPIIYLSLSNKMDAMKISALIAIYNSVRFISDRSLNTDLLPKLKILLDTDMKNERVIGLIVGIFEKLVPRMEKHHVTQYIMPYLLEIKLSDSSIVTQIVRLYKEILRVEKFGLAHNIRVKSFLSFSASQRDGSFPSSDEINNYIEVFDELLANADESQRLLFDFDALDKFSPENQPKRSTRKLHDPGIVFTIPNLRRNTASAEDVGRKVWIGPSTITAPPSATASTTGLKRLGNWLMGATGAGSIDTNFLQVANIIPSLRKSDCTLMTPKIEITPSCASSPGGTTSTAATPTRCHSSIGHEYRGTSPVFLSSPAGRRRRGRGRTGSSSSVLGTSRNIVSQLLEKSGFK